MNSQSATSSGRSRSPGSRVQNTPNSQEYPTTRAFRLQVMRGIVSPLHRRSHPLIVAILGLAALASSHGMDLSIYGPAPDSTIVGATLNFTAFASESGQTLYRFRIRGPGEDFRMIRDFGPINSLDWAPDREGDFELEVAATIPATGETATTIEAIYVASRVLDSHVTISATSHPLVFLFSAPPCATPGRMRIEFSTGDRAVQATPDKECTPDTSSNFYLAGLRADTEYCAHAVLETEEGVSTSDSVTFTTGSLPDLSWSQTPLVPAPGNDPQPFLLATSGGSQVATDLAGRVVWFNPSPMSYATRFEPGGYLWGYLEDSSQPEAQQRIRKVDLLGNTILETNAARVNEQLQRFGKTITGFHHEVRTLSDGRIVALAGTERLLTDIQGPGEVDVLGDMIIVFDRNLQVEWVWDSFDNLDVSRLATGGETCPPGGGACAPFYLALTANDWTHGNAVQETPDGNLLYSARHQDWLIKIAYQNGEGDGHILWRLGKDGDFAYASRDPYPWFSHQHDGNFISDNRLLVFDNSNARISQFGGNSRGQLIELDEANRVATLVLNADLGVKSPAVGSAQQLRNGNYHFDAGFVFKGQELESYAFEVNPSGTIVSTLKANAMLYRSIRIAGLYSVN